MKPARLWSGTVMLKAFSQLKLSTGTLSSNLGSFCPRRLGAFLLPKFFGRTPVSWVEITQFCWVEHVLTQVMGNFYPGNLDVTEVLGWRGVPGFLG